jgi:ribosomal protein S18 acetylase RimI-like enzyme
MVKTDVVIRYGRLQDITLIADLAEKIWWHTYTDIISGEQIRYMLDNIYSEKVLTDAMETGEQKFLLIYDKDSPQGFASFGLRQGDPSVHKLHNIYVLPQTQGKGYGRKLIQEVIQIIKGKGMHVLDLNVNRDNQAKNFYEKMGFSVIREEDIPIGPYWMNDYVMRIEF